MPFSPIFPPYLCLRGSSTLSPRQRDHMPLTECCCCHLRILEGNGGWGKNNSLSSEHRPLISAEVRSKGPLNHCHMWMWTQDLNWSYSQRCQHTLQFMREHVWGQFNCKEVGRSSQRQTAEQICNHLHSTHILSLHFKVLTSISILCYFTLRLHYIT